MYAHVNDGVISPPQNLPPSWAHPDGRTVSNLYALNDDELVQLGWHPVTLTDQPTFDAASQTVDQVLALDGSTVVQSWTVRAMTTDEQAAYNAAAAASLKAQAQSALDKSDVTMIRCVEHGVAVPTEWATYRSALRSIVSTGAGSMPTRPNYPAGT